jgi:hypothetical protein
MATDDYQRALEAAVAEWHKLTRERQALDTRIAQLVQTIGNLCRLCGYEPTVPVGLTDACRMVLRAAGHQLTVAEIRAQLSAMGVDLSRYSNDLAAIHTTLKRLQEAGEVQVVPQAYDKPAYLWLRPPQVVALTKETAEALFGPLPTVKPPRRKK